jgi:hypothetical protein
MSFLPRANVRRPAGAQNQHFHPQTNKGDSHVALDSHHYRCSLASRLARQHRRRVNSPAFGHCRGRSDLPLPPWEVPRVNTKLCSAAAAAAAAVRAATELSTSVLEGINDAQLKQAPGQGWRRSLLCIRDSNGGQPVVPAGQGHHQVLPGTGQGLGCLGFPKVRDRRRNVSSELMAGWTSPHCSGGSAPAPAPRPDWCSQTPASYVAFDVLAVAGHDAGNCRCGTAAGGDPPLSLSPAASDPRRRRPVVPSDYGGGACTTTNWPSMPI